MKYIYGYDSDVYLFDFLKEKQTARNYGFAITSRPFFAMD